MYFFEMESRVGVNPRRQLIVCQYCLRKANLSCPIIILTIDCVFQFLLIPCCKLPVLHNTFFRKQHQFVLFHEREFKSK